MISETKLDQTLPACQFSMDWYSIPLHLDRDGNGNGILLYISEDIPAVIYIVLNMIDLLS